MMEKRRCINQLHWVFDLPDTAGLDSVGREPTRVMMSYDRATNVTRFEVLDKGLPKDVRENISLWLHNNSHVHDALNGPA
jgi:hypothetical protein